MAAEGRAAVMRDDLLIDGKSETTSVTEAFDKAKDVLLLGERPFPTKMFAEVAKGATSNALVDRPATSRRARPSSCRPKSSAQNFPGRLLDLNQQFVAVLDLTHTRAAPRQHLIVATPPGPL